MELLILVLHVIAALGIIGLVLLQHGKGADVGAAFGSGASGSLFGASGSTNFLSRATAILALVFFVTSMGLTAFRPVDVGPVGYPGAEHASGSAGAGRRQLESGVSAQVRMRDW
jgi:preprotein translocase subunit SecG